MSEPQGDRNEWVHRAIQAQTERLASRSCDIGSRLYVSIGLIALGVLLFLGNLGILPIHNVWLFWPVLPILGGIGRLAGSRSASSVVWGVFTVLFGCLFLLSNLGWLRLNTGNGSWIVSLILIAIGFAVLSSVLETSKARQGGTMPPARAFGQIPVQTNGNWLSDFTLFGAVKRKVESDDFAGGTLTSIFGSIEIDLRRAVILSPRNATVVNVTAVFGATKIRVPDEWRIHVNGASILGNFEDKTVPPNTGRDAPMLVITGLAILGSVEIED